MNRDDLMELLFGDDPPSAAHYRNIEEPDDDNPFVVWTRAVLGTRPHRYIVRREFAPGAGLGEAATTILTNEIVYIGVDPDHRGRGFARDLLAGAVEEASSHALTLYLTTNTEPGCVEFFEHFGFLHPERTPEGFLVYALTEENPWPTGVILR